MGQASAEGVATRAATSGPPMDRARFVKELERSGLLTETQLWRCVYNPESKEQDGPSLARTLVQSGIITPYQANQLLSGKAKDLMIGHYRLQERLGQGGMGQVFKAYDGKLNRIVAIKVLNKHHVEDHQAMARFQREIEAVGRLLHPNIIRAYDADEVNGVRFLVMEYVEGFDLGRLVKDVGPLPIELACHCVHQAALGLHHAHECGLVHRDLKPSNLLLDARWVPLPENPSRRTLRYRNVKLLDLGLARFVERAKPGTAPGQMLTQMDQIMGTPDYMAPEQARDSHRASPLSDVYSLGATFYYCLTGKPPFPEGTPLEKLLQHQLEDPKPIESFRTDVPPMVLDLVHAMMAKQPEHRPTDAKAIASELRNWRRSSADMVVVPETRADSAAAEPEAETPQERSAATGLEFGTHDVTLRSLSKTHVGQDKTLWVILGFGVVFVTIVVLIVALLLH